MKSVDTRQENKKKCIVSVATCQRRHFIKGCLIIIMNESFPIAFINPFVAAAGSRFIIRMGRLHRSDADSLQFNFRLPFVI